MGPRPAVRPGALIQQTRAPIDRSPGSFPCTQSGCQHTLGDCLEERLTYRSHARSAVVRRRGLRRRPSSLLERRAGKAEHLQLRREGDNGRLAILCPRPRTHRHLRQRRDALVRAAGARAGVLRTRPCEGPGVAAPRVEDPGTVRLAAQGGFEGRARRRRRGAARNRHGHPRGHDHRGVRADRGGLDRHREASGRPAGSSPK